MSGSYLLFPADGRSTDVVPYPFGVRSRRLLNAKTKGRVAEASEIRGRFDQAAIVKDFPTIRLP